ncbi:unnamed protein product [Effrenium voratum]|nr:unnamed protein product [Effrenium voratum]CAJ1440739.1 unnamed protein product [Effrenium voratum]
MPSVSVAFKYEEKEWAHNFELDASASILDLKRKMTISAPEHSSWFELCNQGAAVNSSDIVDPQVLYDFRYLGPGATKEIEEPVANGATEDGPAPERAEPAPEVSVVRWRIAGGLDKGGIIVRQSESLKSAELGRVSTGAVVEEVARVGERLCYRLEQGSGPTKGWVSIRVSGRELAEKIT